MKRAFGVLEVKPYSSFLVCVLIDKKYNWKYIRDDLSECWYVGSERAVREFMSHLHEDPDAALDDLKNTLLDFYGNFAVIARTGERIVAAVDKIRSYPIFYYHEGNHFRVSNSARTLRDDRQLVEIDATSLLEFRMAGYVTGPETLYISLYQLQAGEMLAWDKKKKYLERNRYYLFISEDFRREKKEDLIEELETVTNRIFLRILEAADGAPIWVPLSGGLDSRLVLCKLRELGCDNLTAFSYGASGNYEAKAAKSVAQKVGVPWHFVPVSMKESKEFFYSSLRQNYWEFSDGLSNIPNMQDIHTLLSLLKQRRFPSKGIIINGQSGDFITGGHIPASFNRKTPSVLQLLDWAIEKHFSLCLDLLTEANIGRIQSKILDVMKINENQRFGRQELASLYEWWEWQERQCKYVINGQRIYDFFQIKWFLPFWEDGYLRFWSQIPFGLKYGQRLYKDYLERFDFYQCFRGFNPQIWRWPGATIMVVPIARMIKLLFGERYSKLFYSYMMYIGHYRQFYAPYDVMKFLRNVRRIRGPISLNTETWIMENLFKDREEKWC